MHQSRKPLVRVGTALLIAVSAVAIGAVFGTAGLGRAASSAAPSNTTPPTISGTPQAGQTLTADRGQWTGRPDELLVPVAALRQERRQLCGDQRRDRAPLRPHGADVGHTLRVRVTARNADGASSDTSVPTAVVAARPPRRLRPAARRAPARSRSAQLSAPAAAEHHHVQLDPAGARRQVGTSSITAKVTACGNRPVQGALVYAAAVPFNQFTVAPEVQSDANGSATLTEPQLSGYPASARQQLLAVFLRARKTGSRRGRASPTSRLVSFKVNLHQ